MILPNILNSLFELIEECSHYARFKQYFLSSAIVLRDHDVVGRDVVLARVENHQFQESLIFFWQFDAGEQLIIGWNIGSAKINGIKLPFEFLDLIGLCEM